MSMLPFFLNDYYDPWEQQRHFRRTRTDWDNFGLGLSPRELPLLSRFPSTFGGRHTRNISIDDEAKVQVGKEGYQVLMDVQQFRPNEISVKTVDNTVIVKGKHEERQDEHGFISREFERKYTLPEGYDPKDVVSTLSSDGVLTIKAPPPQKSITTNERVVLIQPTGPAHHNVKISETEKSDETDTSAKIVSI